VDLFALTRQLVDIESITGNEGAVADFLYRRLAEMKYAVRKIPVEGDRFNLFALPQARDPRN